MRRPARGEGGAESLEFLGAVPFAVIVALVLWQILVVVEQQAEAATDARVLVRDAALCDATRHPGLRDIDAGAAGGTATLTTAGGYVTVTVTLPPQAILPGADLNRLGVVPPSATVSMRHEPC